MGLGGGWAGLTEVSEGRVAIFPHPSAAAQQAVGPQPTTAFMSECLWRTSIPNFAWQQWKWLQKYRTIITTEFS